MRHLVKHILLASEHFVMIAASRRLYACVKNLNYIAYFLLCFLVFIFLSIRKIS